MDLDTFSIEFVLDCGVPFHPFHRFFCAYYSLGKHGAQWLE